MGTVTCWKGLSAATARVWRGRDQLTDREAAVKELLLPAHLPEERADLVARTTREARGGGPPGPAAVVIVFDVVKHEGTPWTVISSQTTSC